MVFKIVLIIKLVEFIRKKEFARTFFNEMLKAFVLYVSFLFIIYFARKAKIDLLHSEKFKI